MAVFASDCCVATNGSTPTNLIVIAMPFFQTSSVVPFADQVSAPTP